jgi:hypothetical protein
MLGHLAAVRLLFKELYRKSGPTFLQSLAATLKRGHHETRIQHLLLVTKALAAILA